MNLKPIALAALMLITSNVYTQSDNSPVAPSEETNVYQHINLNAAEKNIAAALRSGNDGAVESALGLVARLKLSLPERRFEAIEAECVHLITDGGTESIRYKSYLVLNLLGHPRSFTNEARESYKSADEMFGAVANRLQITDLSYSSASR